MINSVVLAGRLVEDPKYFDSKNNEGEFFHSFRIASDYGFNSNNEAKTLFIDCKANNNKAIEYLHKGDKVTIQGRLTSRNYEANDGSQRTVFEILVTGVDLPVKSAEDFEAEEEEPEEEKVVALTDGRDPKTGKRTSGVITNKNGVVKQYKTR